MNCCPHCHAAQTTKLQRTTHLGYAVSYCQRFGRTFNERTGAPFNFVAMPTDIVFPGPEVEDKPVSCTAHRIEQNYHGIKRRYYRPGNCYQDRLRHGCRSRAYKDILTACLDNNFRIYIRPWSSKTLMRRIASAARLMKYATSSGPGGG